MFVLWWSIASPLAAEIVHIDPNNPPPSTLAPEEEIRLRTLLNVGFPSFLSDVSPDDRRVLVWTYFGPAIMDLATGASTPTWIYNQPVFYSTEFRWRDASTLTAIAVANDYSAFYRVFVSADTGAVSFEAYDPRGGYPFSLSPRGNRVLIARAASSAVSGLTTRTAPPFPPIRKKTLPSSRPPGLAKSGLVAQEVDVAVVETEFVAADIASGQEWPLLVVPPTASIPAYQFSDSGTRLAIVRAEFPDVPRGNVPVESPTIQDSLGRAVPATNPFFTNNALEIFELEGRKPRHHHVRPGPPGGDIFLSARFSPDGRTVVATMGVPSHPEGRRYPTYWKPKASRYRFYSADGRRLATLDRPEIEAPFGGGVFFLSPHEVVISTVDRMDWGFFHYNMRSGRLRRLPTQPGTFYQTRATSRSRELLYVHSSIQSPFEMHRIGVNGGAPTALTQLNAGAAAANRVRVDPVSFDLGAAGRRDGLLVQPAGAAFPPQSVPLIVWQGGGPNYFMTNEWGGFVEQPFSLLPNFGYAMLVVPLEGRFNFGPDRHDALVDGRNFGQVDIDEQARIVKQLVRRGWVRESGVGITGCSYGGFFTSQSIVRHPGLYAAANSQCSLLDQLNEWNAGYTATIAYEEGRTLAEAPAEYVKDSPVLNAAAVTTPTLLFAGTNDFFPWEISAAFHDGIEKTGTPARLLAFDGEYHGLSWWSQPTAAEAQLLWFRQHLGLP